MPTRVVSRPLHEADGQAGGETGEDADRDGRR